MLFKCIYIKEYTLTMPSVDSNNIIDLFKIIIVIIMIRNKFYIYFIQIYLIVNIITVVNIIYFKYICYYI